MARHKSKCLSGTLYIWEGVSGSVLACVCVSNGGGKGSVWTGRVSTINSASDLQAAAFLTLSYNPAGTAAS